MTALHIFAAAWVVVCTTTTMGLSAIRPPLGKERLMKL